MRNGYREKGNSAFEKKEKKSIERGRDRSDT